MKKALALLLSLIAVFSMFGVVAAAEEGDAAATTITVLFKDTDGSVIKQVVVTPGTILTPYAPENPAKEATDTTEYTFKGWAAEDGTVYQQSTLPTADGTDTEVVFTASYSEKDISGNQTLLSFIASIFDRINAIFEYFVKIFEGVFDSVEG